MPRPQPAPLSGPVPEPPRRPIPPRRRRPPAAACILASLLAGAAPLLTAGCGLFGSSGPAIGQPGAVTGFLGGAVADEPRAALIGREVLSAGGNAADAAVAIGFALAVTLPSRAGLGAGGGCIAYDPATDGPGGGVPEAVVFIPPAGGGGGDRPAAVPMLPRGLFALHLRYGSQPFPTLLRPAELLARSGFRASRALVQDLQVVAGPLLADPGARAIFAPGGRPVADSDTLTQADLAATLGRLRTSGVGDLYVGLLARQVAAASQSIGGGLTLEPMRTALPRQSAPVTVKLGDDLASFLPPPADGGAATAAALRVLARDSGATQAAQARALAVAARLRSAGGDPAVVLETDLPPGGGGPYPASTTFATLDRQGNAVACALTMNNLFGTGRILPGFGFFLAASPTRLPQPLLAAGIAWNRSRAAFHAAAGGSGQEGAPLAAAYALLTSIRAGRPLPVAPPEPGRANIILCSEYLPGSDSSCHQATDPRGAGLAVGSEP